MPYDPAGKYLMRITTASEGVIVHKRKAIVTGKTWSHCPGGAEAIWYSIENHGHSWPDSSLLPAITSQAINATDVMWDFFVAHPLPVK